jgi:predicted aspartyl protease
MEQQKAVDAVYCDAYVDNHPIYLIIDTGSTGSLISKGFLDKIGRTIQEPSTVNLVDVNGGKKRSLGKIRNLPINIKGTTIPVDVDVSESMNYTVIVGNDWLTKTKGIIDFSHRIMELEYNNRKLRCGISCWEKPKYDEHGKPMGLETKPTLEQEVWNQEIDEIEENDTTEDQQYCVLLGDSNTKPLVEMDSTTITIGQRKEPIEYIQELQQLNQPMINNKLRSRDWKGPETICWCDRVLETKEDVCKTCQQKA